MAGVDFRGTAGEEGNGIVTADGFAIGDVTFIKKVITAVVTLNPSSINDGDTGTVAATVTGAALGDFVLVAPPYSLQGLTMTAYVSAANTVTILLYNNTGQAVDLGEDDWKILVLSA